MRLPPFPVLSIQGWAAVHDLDPAQSLSFRACAVKIFFPAHGFAAVVARAGTLRVHGYNRTGYLRIFRHALTRT